MATEPCRRCGRPIGWVLTDKNRRMPIDPEPDDDGNVICHYEAGVLRATVLSKGNPRPAGVAFMPHFATCSALARRTRRDAAREIEPRKPKPEPAPSLFDN
jgi:hypothetical protein